MLTQITYLIVQYKKSCKKCLAYWKIAEFSYLFSVFYNMLFWLRYI